MIRRVTARIVSGTSAATIRKTIPAATTLGPDSQTIRRTGGKFLKAFRRSSHPLQQVRGLPQFRMTSPKTELTTKTIGTIRNAIWAIAAATAAMVLQPYVLTGSAPTAMTTTRRTIVGSPGSVVALPYTAPIQGTTVTVD